MTAKCFSTHFRPLIGADFHPPHKAWCCKGGSHPNFKLATLLGVDKGLMAIVQKSQSNCVLAKWQKYLLRTLNLEKGRINISNCPSFSTQSTVRRGQTSKSKIIVSSILNLLKKVKWTVFLCDCALWMLIVSEIHPKLTTKFFNSFWITALSKKKCYSQHCKLKCRV